MALWVAITSAQLIFIGGKNSPWAFLRTPLMAERWFFGLNDASTFHLSWPIDGEHHCNKGRGGTILWGILCHWRHFGLRRTSSGEYGKLGAHPFTHQESLNRIRSSNSEIGDAVALTTLTFLSFHRDQRTTKKTAAQSPKPSWRIDFFVGDAIGETPVLLKRGRPMRGPTNWATNSIFAKQLGNEEKIWEQFSGPIPQRSQLISEGCRMLNRTTFLWCLISPLGRSKQKLLCGEGRVLATIYWPHPGDEEGSSCSTLGIKIWRKGKPICPESKLNYRPYQVLGKHSEGVVAISSILHGLGFLEYAPF